MLSTIGRVAIRRATTGANSQSTRRVLLSGWHLHRIDTSKNTDVSSFAQFAFLARKYATASKTTQTKAPRANKAAAKPTQKPKVKLAKGKKSATKKTKKKKVVKKVAKNPVKKKVKKALTPEQALNKDIKELKVQALNPPKPKPSTAWLVVCDEVRSQDPHTIGTASMKNASARYKSLTNNEIAEYNRIASQNKVTNNIAFKQWIESHTPDEIRLANNARTQLKRKTSKKPGAKSLAWPLLHDDRIPKHAKTPWLLFSVERWASGDLAHVPMLEAQKIISKEWQGLSGAEKKKYLDQSQSERTRYVAEYKTVFKRDAPYAKPA
ncbi:hypothetical protein BJ878DRAFT_497611 [Calycina marina]|uniref:HMG box domain-containing protein n=1 Tax=Calycina marina TaxID=1763456 RepID=A0A9P7Z6S4_9HELO|nr:hypothetical protein BJ878DRAFT_497611 [Calycina marina]